MTDYTKKSSTKQSRPSSNYPELLAWLVGIQNLVRELHKSVTQEQIAEKLNTKKQTINYHARKEKEKHDSH
jgi:hypothetical protein